ncbi:hypothetical protein TD95_000923 [Thielaviopsis punctulata]|uniref:Fluoride ion transporter CrcB n=1 Tax=Thielaviopsis punctulata TaxID=72032 RepID=A0A0F4ZEM9_9PEZI|nr:hypothetical protein TD95_000923 [Thielaviopsis punctulata]
METKEHPPKPAPLMSSKWANSLIIHGQLFFWSIFGVLARLGMIALTEYPNAPVSFGVLWANVAGSLIMGFLLEERLFFVETARKKVFGNNPPPLRTVIEPVVEDGGQAPEANQDDNTNLELMESLGESEGRFVTDVIPDPADYVKAKKAIPLYIGLSTGFCGSFTSFSSFLLDTFLAATNDLPLGSKSRADGDSFMAFAAVALLNPAMSLAGFACGGHLARAVAHLPGLWSIPDRVLPLLNALFAALGFGCWVGGIFMTAFPPHDFWRGSALFSVVLGPFGSILRYHLSTLNAGRKYPIGTLAANLLGTMLLGAFFDAIHAPVKHVVGCQVLFGLSDGFCGCLTTVSTWVAELSALGTKRSYIYGMVSFSAAFLILVPVVGGLRWSHGFEHAVC